MKSTKLFFLLIMMTLVCGCSKQQTESEQGNEPPTKIQDYNMDERLEQTESEQENGSPGANQDCNIDERLVCENGLYFLVENGKYYPVNMNVITVKLKPGEVIGEEFEIIRSNKLGFIDLSVPEGIDILDFVCILKKTGKFELVELNVFGEYC